MGPIEEIGLLKMDFLGLSNLTIIKNALRIIKKIHGKEIDINTLPLDDKKTYELFQRGDTTGIFQFESAGMKRYLKELQPSEFEDIIAMGALYRPGPLSAGLTDSFIKEKMEKKKLHMTIRKMKPALESTYGVLVYQEQFMQISREVCGFSGGEADIQEKLSARKSVTL
jgi:DNA polymerase-3 subunit alpha